MEKLKILLLVGGSDYHDSAQHRKSLLTFLEKKYDVTLSEKTESLLDLDNYDVFVNQSSILEPTDKEYDSLFNFIASSKDMVGIHSATWTFLNSEKYLEILGGEFIGHDPFKTFLVETDTSNRPEDRIEDHVITEGVKNFRIVDELYVIEGDMTKWHILARAEHHPILWWKDYGKGRVVYNALGHDSYALDNPSFQALTTISIDWVAKSL